MTYPFVQSPQKLKQFLQKIPEVGTPAVVDVEYLKLLGFTSSNDKTILATVKFLGLVENKKGGAPTKAWTSSRVKLAETLGEIMPKAYSELFSVYPNADKVDKEVLSNFFKSKTDHAAGTVSKIVTTFTTLREMATFNYKDDGVGGDSEEEEHVPESSKSRVNSTVGKSDFLAPSVNLNVQLQLPSDASGEVYEKFFAAMKKYLYTND